jgi:hypothetical protein
MLKRRVRIDPRPKSGVQAGAPDSPDPSLAWTARALLNDWLKLLGWHRRRELISISLEERMP